MRCTISIYIHARILRFTATFQKESELDEISFYRSRNTRARRHFFSATADIRLFIEVMFTVRGATVDCRRYWLFGDYSHQILSPLPINHLHGLDFLCRQAVCSSRLIFLSWGCWSCTYVAREASLKVQFIEI